MDKREMLIQLYELKDRKRRRLLMDLFRDKIVMDISIKFICQLINNELERPNMVTKKDVVYCRFHFAKKLNVATYVAPPPITKNIPKVAPPSVIDDGKVSWSNPDETDFKKQLTKTTKFSKS